MSDNFNLSKHNNEFNWHPFLTDFFDWAIDSPQKTSHGYLKTDIKEFEKNYILYMEVPGYSKDNIDISYNDGYLTVNVSAENGYNEKNEYVRKERFFENYTRKFYVGKINETDINASLNDGVLMICIPKVTKTAPENKRILIN